MTADHDVRGIFDAGVRAVQADRVVASVDWASLLHGAERVVVVGAGKASMAMAGAVEEHLEQELAEGIVVVPHGYRKTLPHSQRMPRRIDVLEGGHPVPDEDGREAAERVLDLAAYCSEDDLLLVLLSGGGSALWPAPIEGISLSELQHVNQMLLRCGAAIGEINAVRKHLSRIKGGRLAAAAYPARVETLVISDVVGDAISVIASGPTVEDPSTYEEACSVFNQYQLWEQVPESVRKHLQAGRRGGVSETPKPGEEALSRSTTHMLATNRTALEAAQQESERRGYVTQIVEAGITGEAREVGRHLARRLLQEVPTDRPVCLLWGGETTVTIRGKGKGGRNQELAMAAALELDGASSEIVFLSGGTDGIDGPTDAAGAWVTTRTVSEATAQGIDPEALLRDNDSYRFFEAVGSHLQPGPTHTNVMDVQIGLVSS